MNKLTIIGNLVRDPETGTTESGVNWCQFTVAVNRRNKKEVEPEADYIRVTAWRGLGDSCAKYLGKGRKVAVVGTPKPHGWIGQDGTAKAEIELQADDVEFLSSGNGGGNRAPTDAYAPPAPRSQETPQAAPMAQQQQMPIAGGGFTQVETDELPF